MKIFIEMAAVASKNIFEFLDDTPEVVVEETKAASAPVSKSKPTQGNKPKGKSGPIHAKRPAVAKDVQFFEKPQHNKAGGDTGKPKHHNHGKPARGRAFDKKPANGFRKEEKKEKIVGEEIEKTEAVEEYLLITSAVETAAEEPSEPEIEYQSYEEYKASQLIGSKSEARPPNEGKSDPKWERMTAVEKEEEVFFGGKVS